MSAMRPMSPSTAYSPWNRPTTSACCSRRASRPIATTGSSGSTGAGAPHVSLQIRSGSHRPERRPRAAQGQWRRIRPRDRRRDSGDFALLRRSSVARIEGAQVRMGGQRGTGRFRIGDCKAPAQLNQALWDAHRLAREFDSPHPAYPLPWIRERQLWGSADHPQVGRSACEGRSRVRWPFVHKGATDGEPNRTPLNPRKERTQPFAKARHLTMISIGGIIGAGLFVSSSTSIIAGGPASFISYAICGLLILLVMRMLGEMATALPQVRSFTEFARAGLGEGAGFVVGWLYWYFWVLVVPVEAIAGAKILQQWLPLLAAANRHRPDDRHDLRQSHVGALLCRIRILVRLHQGRGHRRLHRDSRIVRVRLDRPAWRDVRQSRRHGGFTPHGWIAVLAAVPTVFFAMTGAEITTIAAAESAQPGRAVARMSSAVIGRILMFYVISVFLIVSVTPWDTVRSGESPFTLALNTMHVPWAGGS